jgi:ParB family transcriptional regulator, chromosome partitioning protein
MARMFDNAAVMAIAPDDVDPDIKGRIGLYFPQKAEALAVLIKADGQSDPIKVVVAKGARPWKLVAGLHRLEGCRIAGIPVKAIEVLGDADELIDIQASENLHRRRLGPIERACFVRAIADAAEAKIKAAHGGKSQQEIAISARWDKVKLAAPARASEVDRDTALTMIAVYGWADQVAAAMDMSVAAIRRDLALHRNLVALFPTLAKQLAMRPIGDNAAEMIKLSKVHFAQREAVIKELLAYPALTVDEALQRLLIKVKAPAAEGQTKFQNNFFANWDRFDLSSKRQALPQLVEKLTPSLRTELRALLDGEDA